MTPPKKKILYISTKSVLGGAQRYIVDLADYLPKNEFEIAVAAGGRGPLAIKMNERGIHYYEIRGLDRDISAFKDIGSFFRLLSLMRKIKPDIIHLNGFKVSVLGAIAGRLAGAKKIISSTHGWSFLEERPPSERALARTATRIGGWFQDKIVCVSQFDYDAGMQYRIANPKKLVQIHNGVDPKKHIFLTREEARNKIFERIGIHPGDYFLVGTIAEYTKNKGLLYLIEAATHSIAVKKNIIFILMGWGEDSELLGEQILYNHIFENVFLVDSLPEAFTYLKALDLFVLPSVKEGFAYTLLEASLAELPIITTRVGGNPEIIENMKNGMLIKPASPEEIINAISYFISKPNDRAFLGKAARQKVLADYPISKMIEKTREVYVAS